MATIIRIEQGSLRSERFAIRGDAESQEWIDTLRPPEEAWCEITLWDGEHVGSYGGSVWPMAWPSLFRVVGRRGSQRTLLTEAGREAFAAARAAAAVAAETGHRVEASHA